MSMDGIPKIGKVGGLEELAPGRRPAAPDGAGKFADSLQEAIRQVDDLQRDSETAQATFAAGGEIDLHDVLIRIEEAELAFKTMMEVRNKLVDAYHEVMRLGG